MRVSKQLGRDLIIHCKSIVLEQEPKFTAVPSNLDCELCFGGFSVPAAAAASACKVTLRWKEGCRAQQLAEVLSLCKGLIHLNMAGCVIGEGACARVLCFSGLFK